MLCLIPLITLVFNHFGSYRCCKFVNLSTMLLHVHYCAGVSDLLLLQGRKLNSLQIYTSCIESEWHTQCMRGSKGFSFHQTYSGTADHKPVCWTILIYILYRWKVSFILYWFFAYTQKNISLFLKVPFRFGCWLSYCQFSLYSSPQGKDQSW